ncbi:Eco57I restriction-modification methylase domain-containing protein [Halorubrum halophilum]|uniref:Eco57I restriction-modification methylase domain-containing protein n=1 Tax=Halorubrum halophilum TaxID=413816 RepID=UPI0009E578A1|nr:N-6 DNA methylase [Halorubrum halophilum]
MSMTRSSPFGSTDTVGDIIKHLVDDLEFQNLVDGQNQTEFGNGYGTEFNLRHDGDTVVRVIEIPSSGPDRSTVNSYLKRHGKKSNKELFSVIVQSEGSNKNPLQRSITSEITFMRIERRRATQTVDIEHDLKYFRVDIDNPAPMYLDYFNDMRVGNQSYNSVLENVKEIFSLKEVTKGFYRDFAEIFQDELQNSIHGLRNQDENLTSYTQSVVNRILFLMFVQEKGWLDGDQRYIQNKYEEAKKEKSDVYDDFFRPLFFEALNTEGIPENDFIGKVPYLNGGLFEKKEIEENVTIDEEFFDVLLSPEEDEYGNPEGFLLQYKLSLSESNPAEQELVVDPEFIGRIFEMFMQSEERSEKGAFYTPKEVTQYMSKNALKQYLLEDFPEKEAELSKLVSDHGVSESFDKTELEDIRNKVKSVDIVDPAVGSGAFVISMLEELTEITEALNNALGYEEDRFNLKEEFIARSLYGVDIDSSGIELCKFRTWLHLMQDLDDVGLDEFLENNEKYALPNLGFKFFIGNSLSGDFKPTEIRDVLDNIGEKKGGDRSMQTTIGARHTGKRDLSDIVDEVDEKREEYLDSHGEEKNRLEEELGNLIKEIDGLIDWESSDYWMDTVTATEEDSFKWSVNIPEVVLDGGFDIVIGNPPYKGNPQLDYILPLSNWLDERSEHYDKPIRKDLYQLFIFRAFELAREGGTVSFITSNTWLNIMTKMSTRILLQTNYLKEVIDVSEDIFDATVDPAIFTAINRNESNYTTKFINASDTNTADYRSLVHYENLSTYTTCSAHGTEYAIEYGEISGCSVYQAPIILYRNSLRRNFFVPTKENIRIYERYMEKMVSQYEEWGDILSNTSKHIKMKDDIEENVAQELEPGEVALLGLLTFGGRGFQTGNNEEYIAFLEGTPEAKELKNRNDDFQYVQKNENRYKWLSKVVQEKHIANVEDLSKKEKLNGIDENDPHWVPLEKGFRKDETYYKPHSVFINWSKKSLKEIDASEQGRLQHLETNFKEGLFASRGGFSDLMVRYVNNSVIDTSGISIIPMDTNLSAKYLCGLLNSSLLESIVETFINGSGKQTADMRLIPIVCPKEEDLSRMESLVEDAIEIRKGNSDRDINTIQQKIDELTEEIYKNSWE